MQLTNTAVGAWKISSTNIGDDAYFENGRFNPIYVPQGFDFINNRVTETIVDYHDISLVYPNLLGSNKVVLRTYSPQNMYNPNEQFTIENGVLKFSHFVPKSYLQNKAYWICDILLPLANATQFFSHGWYVHIHNRLTVENWSLGDKNQYIFDFAPCWIETDVYPSGDPDTLRYRYSYTWFAHDTSNNKDGFNWRNSKTQSYYGGRPGDANPISYFHLSLYTQWITDSLGMGESTINDDVKFTYEIDKIYAGA